MQGGLNGRALAGAAAGWAGMGHWVEGSRAHTLSAMACAHRAACSDSARAGSGSRQASAARAHARTHHDGGGRERDVDEGPQL